MKKINFKNSTLYSTLGLARTMEKLHLAQSDNIKKDKKVIYPLLDYDKEYLEKPKNIKRKKYSVGSLKNTKKLKNFYQSYYLKKK